MSSYEYIDLCKKAQNSNSKYHVFTFDIIGSKKMSKECRIAASIKIEALMNKIYNEIRSIEEKENRKILLKEDIVPYKERRLVNKKFGLLFEPFLYADTFGFTVYTGSIDEEEVYNIYNKYKEELEITFSFHLNNIYYETNDYGLGGELFFRGYAIDICSTLHKEEYNKIKVKKHNNKRK